MVRWFQSSLSSSTIASLILCPFPHCPKLAATAPNITSSPDNMQSRERGECLLLTSFPSSFMNKRYIFQKPLCKFPLYLVEACEEILCIRKRNYPERRWPFAESHSKNNACKLRVHYYAESGFHRQAWACKTPEYFRPPDVLYHECGSRTRTYQGGKFACTVCKQIS